MSDRQEVYEALAEKVVEKFNELDKISAETLAMAELMIRLEVEHEDSLSRHELLTQELSEMIRELVVVDEPSADEQPIAEEEMEDAEVDGDDENNDGHGDN